MEIGVGPYFKPYERDSASVQATEAAESVADAATAVIGHKRGQETIFHEN